MACYDSCMVCLLHDKGEARVAGYTFKGRVDASVERSGHDRGEAKPPPNHHQIVGQDATYNTRKTDMAS